MISSQLLKLCIFDHEKDSLFICLSEVRIMTKASGEQGIVQSIVGVSVVLQLARMEKFA